MKRLFASFLLICLLLTACAVPEEARPSDCLVIHYIDVDQADCMLLLAGDTAIMIDGGNTGTSQEVLAYLKRFGVEQIDLMVNTHPHGDHLGGIPTVLNNIPTDEIWCADSTYDTYLYKNFTQLVQQKGFNISHPEPGTKFEENNVSVTVLGPLNPADKYSDLNDTSLVLMVEYGQRKFLFTGDMEAYAEKQLVDAKIDLKADILKVGHHGSYSSTSQIFLDKVKPQYGIISCGRNNEYGHPHDAPIIRLDKADVKLFRTDLMGSIVVVTNGQDLAFFLETRNTELNGYESAA
jgi:competence protein ComEC